MSGQQKSTIYDVADLAQVSITTVSRVLNSPHKVKQLTLAKVLKAIDELGYIPKAEASARARQSLGRIGILTPFFFTFPSFVQRMRGVATVLAETSSELVIYPVDSPDRLNEYFAMLSTTKRIDGLIVMSLKLNALDADRLKKNDLKTVLIETSHPNFSSIEIDNHLGGAMAARTLLEQGHQRCAFVGYGDLPSYSLRPGNQRLAGYQETLLAEGLSLPEDYIKRLPLKDVGNPQYINDLLDLPNPPTAIFATADDLALLVLKVARQRGIAVPENLAVIGFDDLDVMEQIGLTTIRQPLDESGQLAAKLLFLHLNDSTHPIQHIQLPLSVAKRETV